MAKEVIERVYCDICGAEGAESHSFIYDRRMDAAGSMENWWYDVDLCSIHFGELVRTNGDPAEHRMRTVGRSKAIQYGTQLKEWVEAYEVVWAKMTLNEKRLSLAIEGLSEQKCSRDT